MGAMPASLAIQGIAPKGGAPCEGVLGFLAQACPSRASAA